MKPVFNKGQLNPTITTPSQLVKLCTENVNERQQALLKKYKLSVNDIRISKRVYQNGGKRFRNQ